MTGSRRAVGFLSSICPPQGGCQPVVFPVCSDDAPPGWGHPAAPAPALVPPGGRTFAAWLLHQTEEAVSPPANCVLPSGVFPLVKWKDSEKRPVLSAHNSRMFRHPRTICIFFPGCRLPLPHAPPEQVVKAVKLGPSRTILLPCPTEMEVKV